MSYLEKNRTNLREIRDIDFQDIPRNETSSRSNAKFIPIGSYFSPTVGREMWLGVKTLDAKYSDDRIRSRLSTELAIMDYVVNHIPHLAAELPLFYGLLKGDEGYVIGILTEDFTDGGKHKIQGGARLDTELEQALRPVLSRFDFDHMGFQVTDSSTGEQWRRLGDFYPAGLKDDKLRRASYDIYDELYEENNPYTIIDKR